MKPDEYKRARKLICQLGTYGSCEFCSLSDVDDCCEQTDEAEKILLELFGICPKGYEEAEKEKCRSDALESSVMAFKLKTGISYGTDKNKPLRSDFGAKSAKPYPQDTEEDEYRYIDAGWLEAVARGLTAGAKKHPGETWRQIPPEEHAARAMRHLNLYRAGDRKDTHLINAAMRCMMAYATERVRGEGQLRRKLTRKIQQGERRHREMMEREDKFERFLEAEMRKRRKK